MIVNAPDILMLLTGKMCKILRLQQIVLLIQLLLIAYGENSQKSVNRRLVTHN